MTVRGEMAHFEAPTETRNPHTVDIDQLCTLDVLRRINAEDQLVPGAVATILPSLATAVDFAVAALRYGGRVHYVGAGTSGRLAVLDAAELPPTFNIPAGRFVAHHAGGLEALQASIEDAEDDADAGAAAIHQSATAGDLVVGLAASGRTPYVIGALRAARELGGRTALMSANPKAPANAEVDVALPVDTGPEAIAGSTRMKAGTAQKMVLTAFSTAVMIRLGHTYSNLMVSLRATNAKLRGRTVRILTEATGMSPGVCSAALAAADDELKVALVHLLSGVDMADASLALERNDGHVRAALRTLFR